MLCLKYISVLFLLRHHCARPSSPILVSMFLWVTRMAPSTKPRSYVQFSKPGALTFENSSRFEMFHNTVAQTAYKTDIGPKRNLSYSLICLI